MMCWPSPGYEVGNPYTYCCHHDDPERKDMPHDRNESANGVGKQGLSPDRHGIASRSDPAPLDRRAFGDLPDVGTTRAKNEYGHHDVLADRPACVSKALAAASLWQNGEWSADHPRRCAPADPGPLGAFLSSQPVGKRDLAGTLCEGSRAQSHRADPGGFLERNALACHRWDSGVGR